MQCAKQKSGCACPSDNVKEILTCPKHGASVPIAQLQHFHPGPTCLSNIELVNSTCPDPEFVCPGHSDAYFFAHWFDVWLKNKLQILQMSIS